MTRNVMFAGKYLQFILTDLGWEYVRRTNGSNGVAIVGMTVEKRLLLVEQHRSPVDKPVIELPAGLVDPAEDELATAKRELLEETGYTCGNLELLCKGTTSPGLTNELNSVYLASGLVRVENPEDDIHLENGVVRHRQPRGIVEEGESVAVYEVPLPALYVWLDRQRISGKLVDLKVHIALSFIHKVEDV